MSKPSIEELNTAGITDKLSESESRGRYHIENQVGYLGKYQLGEAAMIEVGLYKKDGSGKNDWKGEWSEEARSLGVNSKADFLNNAQAQELAFTRLMEKNWHYIKAHKDITMDNGEKRELTSFIGEEFTYKGEKHTITAESLIMGSHLLGVGGLSKTLSHFKEGGGVQLGGKDGNGTDIYRYMADGANLSDAAELELYKNAKGKAKPGDHFNDSFQPLNAKNTSQYTIDNGLNGKDAAAFEKGLQEQESALEKALRETLVTVLGAMLAPSMSGKHSEKAVNQTAAPVLPLPQKETPVTLESAGASLKGVNMDKNISILDVKPQPGEKPAGEKTLSSVPHK